jgi:hypothetical protein
MNVKLVCQTAGTLAVASYFLGHDAVHESGDSFPITIKENLKMPPQSFGTYAPESCGISYNNQVYFHYFNILNYLQIIKLNPAWFCIYGFIMLEFLVFVISMSHSFDEF